jgi:hypothetical protein
MYEKLTVKSFKDALASKKYETPTAARRAVGKASTLSDTEKDQCRKAIDNHFGSEPVKKPVVKKPVAKKPAKAVAAKAVAAKATKAVRAGTIWVKPVKAAKPAKAPRGKRAEASAPNRLLSIFDSSSCSFGSLDDFKNLTTQMRIAEKTIQNTGSALGTLIEAKKICPDADLASNIESASAVLSSAVEIFRGVTHKVTSYMAADARSMVKKAEATVGGNGAGSAVFDETSP